MIAVDLPAHPHVRGEHVGLISDTGPQFGSSPRVGNTSYKRLILHPIHDVKQHTTFPSLLQLQTMNV